VTVLCSEQAALLLYRRGWLVVVLGAKESTASGGSAASYRRLGWDGFPLGAEERHDFLIEAKLRLRKC